MPTIASLEVFCDECGCGCVWEGKKRSDLPTYQYFLKNMEAKGYKIGKRVICPKCQKDE